MFSPIRTLAVTVAACGFLFLPGSTRASSGPNGAVTEQTLHKRPAPHPSAGPAERQAAPAAPKALPEKEQPASRERDPAEQTSTPDDDEEVSPGESPTSCDGCELAGFGLAGSLWGLFGVARSRRTPRSVRVGMQPR